MKKSVLITGASRGIGKALAQAFAKAGWRVFAGARDPASLEQTSQTQPLALDVRDDHSIENARRIVTEQADSLDLLINNAAIFPGEGQETLAELDLAWFGEAFETNVTGVARVSRAFLPLLEAASGSGIANISSGAGSISAKDDFAYYPYSVSKAALNMLSRAMAAEFAARRIWVVAISPGWVRTEMGGADAPLTPEESAASLFDTLTRIDLSSTGKFLARDGDAHEYDW